MNDHVRSEDLAAYVDGFLNAESRSAVESHIAGCRQCLDELAEVTALVSNREKVPKRFLERALGGQNRSRLSVFPTRLAFEVAAAVVVAVFIGYLFLGNNRFWQVPAAKRPAEVSVKKDLQPATPAVVASREPGIDASSQNRRRAVVAEAGRSDSKAESEEKMKVEANRVADEKIGDERSALKKVEIAAADKGAAAPPAATAPTPTSQDRLQAKLEERPQAIAAAEAVPQKEAAVEPAAADDAGHDALALNQGVARAKQGKGEPLSAVRLEGEAGMSDLRNPERLSAWSWLRQGLALVLGIDGAGNVIEVVLEGRFAPPDAKLAESEARKLLFFASEKKLRRARVVAGRP